MKRGISHIEMIIGFLILLGAVIGSMYMIWPYNNDKNWVSDIDLLKIKIENNLSSQVYRYGVLVNTEKVNEKTLAVNLSTKGLINPKVRVANISGWVINATLNSTNNITYVEWNESLGNFFYVLMSDGIIEQDKVSGFPILYSEKYNLSTRIKFRALNYEKISDFIDRYNTNYAVIKKEMGLERLNDFGIIFYEGNKINITSKVPIESSEVYGKFNFKKAMDNYGNITSIKFGVMIW